MAKAPKAPPPAEGAEEAPKKKSKLLVIVLAALVLGAAGGGAAWWYFASAQGGSQKAQKHEEAKPPVFTRLDQFTVNLQRGGDGEDHYLQVEVDLQVANDKVIDAIKQRMPQIRNAVLLILSSKTAEVLAPVEGKQRLAQELAQEINRIIGIKQPGEGVVAVYFSAFVIQ